MINVYSDVRDLVSLVAAMREIGLSQSDIQSYRGGNFLHVLKTCVG